MFFAKGLSSLLCEPLMIDDRYRTQLISMALQELSGDAENVHVEDPVVDVSLHDGNSGDLISGDFDSSSFDEGSVIAVVPIAGVITRHGYYGWRSSSPGTLEIGRHLQRLDRDPAVGAIVLSVDSPGGSVYGTPELSAILFGIRKRGKTETVAAVDPLMASAASYIATAADKVYAVPSADVGSIGVVWAYSDYSKYLADLGIDIEILRIPDKKARFSGVEPLDDDMRKTMEDNIAETYEKFVVDMARNRGVTEKHVQKRFGGGEVMSAADGVEAGMIDGIMSLDDIVLDLVGKQNSKTKDRRRSAAEQRSRDLELLASEN